VIPIPAGVEYRRVSVTLEILLCGAPGGAAVAHAEAVERLERAIGAVGGVNNLHAGRSQVGQSSSPVGARRPPVGRGEG